MKKKIDIQSLFTVIRDNKMKRFDFTPTKKGHKLKLIGILVSFSECDNEEDAWIAVYKGLKLWNSKIT